MRIDSHQHFWKYSAPEYSWIGKGMERLAQDYLPADLEPLAREAGIGGSVAVQARQTFEETNWLLDLADRNPFIRGVVGWVDLQSDRVEEQLHACAKRPQCVGVRHVVQDEPDPRFVLQEKFVRGLKHLHHFSLTYDLLIVPHQLPAALELVKKLPEQPFVIDHIAKPQIKAGEIDAWQQDIQAIASQPHVLCKLSGIVTQATWSSWKREDFTRYLDVVLEAFGPQRLMFGSDWPVCLLAADYTAVAELVKDFLARLSVSEQADVWGGTATRFYRLPPVTVGDRTEPSEAFTIAQKN